MSSEIFSALMQKLMKPSFFGIKLWILIALVLSLVTFVTITILCLCFTLCRHRKKPYKSHFHWSNFQQKAHQNTSSPLDRRLLNVSESMMNGSKAVLSGQMSGRTSASYRNDVESSSTRSSVVKDAWRKEFSLLEINVATNELAKENVIGIGDHGTVYHGVLFDGTRVAVKKLLLNSFQAEEFIAQVEELGHIRHKNLANLLGFCLEGVHRMIVCEYVDNKSLHHWLHQCPDQQLSPLTWAIRTNIIRGIARGLAYLHEGIEEGILHRSLKSSNILLDHQWNPKVSDFGIAKLFSPRWAFLLMEALGYIAPDHNVSPFTFTAKDDVYSFGVLIMEIITGRTPINRHQSQPYLVEWLKCMVACENIENVVDPSLSEVPCLKELKRIVLVALRCVDPDEEHRPNIGDVTHMLEPRDLLLGEDELQYLSSI